MAYIRVLLGILFMAIGIARLKTKVFSKEHLCDDNLFYLLGGAAEVGLGLVLVVLAICIEVIKYV